jgi:hypothetical protein
MGFGPLLTDIHSQLSAIPAGQQILFLSAQSFPPRLPLAEFHLNALPGNL